MRRQQLYLSTVSAGCDGAAAQAGLGLELADFCMAANFDAPAPELAAALATHEASAERFLFHAPFSELCPAAIDPLVAEVTRRRYRQAMEKAACYRCPKVIVHTGFVPTVYFPEWFIEKSVLFWQDFLQEVPAGITVCLENVMEPSPEIPAAIVRGVSDPRLRLCLDVGHANSQVSQLPVADWVEQTAPYLSHLHLHNNQGGWDTHESLGRGTIPMETILTLLAALPQPLTYTIESMQAAENVRWLQEKGFLEC